MTVWSAQQGDIFSWFKKDPAFFSVNQNHLVVRARAGTGKTTTIIEAIKWAVEKKILLCAFNRRIMLELQARVTGGHVDVKTLHGLGYSYVMAVWHRIGVDNKGERAAKLTADVTDGTVPEVILRLITKLHTLGRETVPHARRVDDLLELAYNFECVPENGWADHYPVEWIVEKALAAMYLAARVKPAAIDFADMIFLPVRNHWIKPRYDMVVVDEAQDMTTAQLELATRSCRGRIVIVGDDRQAIYGFRGADSDSLDRLKLELNAKELGLTTTYRCGKNIVALAKQLVPDYNAYEKNGDGEIFKINPGELQDKISLGSFVLSRKNAPLINVAMSLLRRGIRARIAGRDIGAGLQALIKRLAKGDAAYSIDAFLAKLDVWEQREVNKAVAAKRETRVTLVQDQAETLRALSEDVETVEEVSRRIAGLFTDDGLGEAGVVTCSSVHKAKGLEANTVFVLEDTFFPVTRQEEANIRYVAITRARQQLYLVSDFYKKEEAA